MSVPPSSAFDLFAETRRALLDALARTEQQAQTYTAEMVQQTEERARQRLAELGQRGAELERRASEMETALTTLRDQIDQVIQGLTTIREQASALEQEARATVRLSPLADEDRPGGAVGEGDVAPSSARSQGEQPAAPANASLVTPGPDEPPAAARLEENWEWRSGRAESSTVPPAGTGEDATQETLRYLRTNLESLDATPGEEPPTDHP